MDLYRTGSCRVTMQMSVQVTSPDQAASVRSDVTRWGLRRILACVAHVVDERCKRRGRWQSCRSFGGSAKRELDVWKWESIRRTDDRLRKVDWRCDRCIADGNFDRLTRSNDG